MRWIVGLELRPRGHGALQFARWLAGQPGAGQDRFAAVHVLEDDHLKAVLRTHHLDEVVAAARAAAAALLARQGLSGLVEAEVVQGLRADEALGEAGASGRGDAIVVGRAAARESRRLVRLGRVARGLLHRLDCPVVVVPPDLEARDLGQGPVVALASLADDSVEACRFAGRLAARLGRPLAVAHVVPLLDAGGLPSLPAESLQRLGRDRRGEAQVQLGAWLAGHGLGGDERVVLEGQLAQQAVAFAEARGSPLLVAGSRRLSAVGRALHVSAAGELAAVASLPVAVVPPRG